jgi:hypothetical protein
MCKISVSLIYTITTNTLHEALITANELKSTAGISPLRININSNPAIEVDYYDKDSTKVIAGLMTEEEYIIKHKSKQQIS